MNYVRIQKIAYYAALNIITSAQVWKMMAVYWKT